MFCLFCLYSQNAPVLREDSAFAFTSESWDGSSLVGKEQIPIP